MLRATCTSMFLIGIILVACAGNSFALNLEAETLEEAKSLAKANNTLIYIDFYSPN